MGGAMTIKEFIKHHFRHFNAAVVVDASEAYVQHLAKGGKMFMTIAGAMSTAELGISLAEMIRKDKVHGICCTGANLEEDLFNLVAHEHYKRIPHYRYLTAEHEQELYEQSMNRVTDTCIPEHEAMRRLEAQLIKVWKEAEQKKKRYFPWEFTYQVIKKGLLEEYYQIDPKNSWVIAACEKNIPIFTPGWEDSTIGNFFVSLTRGRGGDNFDQGVKDIGIVKSGLEQMSSLIDWYKDNTKDGSLGFFQIGGGIAGDFPI